MAPEAMAAARGDTPPPSRDSGWIDACVGVGSRAQFCADSNHNVVRRTATRDDSGQRDAVIPRSSTVRKDAGFATSSMQPRRPDCGPHFVASSTVKECDGSHYVGIEPGKP
jgi:hypothetical protein